MTSGWTPFERERRRWVEELGYPTVLNVRRGHDPQLRRWAEATQRFVYIGRAARGGYKQSKWHNPYPFHAERDRATVLAQYRQYLLRGCFENHTELRAKRRTMSRIIASFSNVSLVCTFRS
jgi:Domain of unknown function (DUF4326)